MHKRILLAIGIGLFFNTLQGQVPRDRYLPLKLYKLIGRSINYWQSVPGWDFKDYFAVLSEHGQVACQFPIGVIEDIEDGPILWQSSYEPSTHVFAMDTHRLLAFSTNGKEAEVLSRWRNGLIDPLTEWDDPNAQIEKFVKTKLPNAFGTKNKKKFQKASVYLLEETRIATTKAQMAERKGWISFIQALDSIYMHFPEAPKNLALADFTMGDLGRFFAYKNSGRWVLQLRYVEEEYLYQNLPASDGLQEIYLARYYFDNRRWQFIKVAEPLFNKYDREGWELGDYKPN